MRLLSEAEPDASGVAMARARSCPGAGIGESPNMPDKEGAGWAYRVRDDRILDRGGPQQCPEDRPAGFSSTSVGPARDRSATGPRNVTQCWADV